MYKLNFVRYLLMLWQSDAIVQTVSASAFLATNQGIAQEASQPMAAVEKERFLEHSSKAAFHTV